MNSVKNVWRTTLKKRLTALTDEEIAAYSHTICQKIYHSPSWAYNEVIALFAALPSEPQLRRVAEMAWVENKTVLLPKVHLEQNCLLFYRLNHWDELQPGAWGILEPGVAAPPHPWNQPIDLICVPGLGFDRRGARLGRGKGFYDRFLAAIPPSTIKLGVFFSVQEIKEIPEMEHDLRMDGIVTEQDLFLL